MSEHTLELIDVSRVLGTGVHRVKALSDVSLVIDSGELVAVMGPSGSGKTTLLSLAGALDSPTSGVVSIDGSALAALSTKQRANLRRDQVGFVFQSYNLIPTLTAVENVSLPLELAGASARAAADSALKALHEVGLDEASWMFPDELSGGQQQRVAVARAMIGERRLILADEPTGALDSATGEVVMESIRSRCDRGAAALVVTHDSRLAGWADRVLFLRDGQIVDQTPPAAPATDYRNTSREA